MTWSRSFVLIHSRALYLSLSETHHLPDVFNPCVCLQNVYFSLLLYLSHSVSDGSLAHNYSFPTAILPLPTHHPFPFSLDLRGAETKAQARQNVYLCT